MGSARHLAGVFLWASVSAACYAPKSIGPTPDAPSCYRLSSIGQDSVQPSSGVVMLEPGQDSGRVLALEGFLGWGAWHRLTADSLKFGVGHTIVEQVTLVRRGKTLEAASVWYSDFVMVNEPNPPHRRALMAEPVQCSKYRAA